MQFQIDGANFGAPVSLEEGQAVSGTTSSLQPGGHEITANYLGTVYYGPSSGDTTQTIESSKPTPTVTVTTVFPSFEPYGSGLSSLITATLSWTGGGPAPTAKGLLLSFSSKAAGGFTPVLCVGKTSPILCGTLFNSTSTDAASNYTITASYAGDNNYTPASSAQTNNFTNCRRYARDADHAQSGHD